MKHNWEFDSWRTALITGFALSTAHRLILGIWMAVVWLTVGQRLPQALVPRSSYLPVIGSQVAYAVLGVWRRWDAIHYYYLALEGYNASNPGPTVFGPLTPLAMRLFHSILPGPIDVGALVMSTIFFGLALALLYRVCEVYYDNEQLGRQAIIITVLLPLSYYFSAPMSESLYLAAVLGVFLATTRGRWWLAGLSGFFAVLARNQGVALFGIALLLLIERQPKKLPIQIRLFDALKKSVPLLLIVFGYVVFTAFRASRDLPSLIETYYHYSFHFFTDPLTSLIYNARFVFIHLPSSLLNVDFWALLVSIGLGLWALSFENHRRLPLLAYNFGYLMLFVTKVNWVYGTHIIAYSGSIGRYSLTLFPLTVLIADRVRHFGRRKRLTLITFLTLSLLVFSALHVLFIGPP